MKENYIVKGIGGFYYVRTSEGVVECKARGIFRKKGITPVAGDWVRLAEEKGSFVIDEILPRKNLLVRPPVANLDTLFIVASTTQPVPSALVLDTLTAIAEEKEIQPVLVFTKGDLADGEKLRRIYEQTPIPFIEIDYQTGAGVEQVRQRIQGHFCAFCGNSGVGKSTLLNAVAPDFSQRTGQISQKLGRGRHTTREVEVFEACGGRIADTPGFASLDTLKACHIPKENLQFDFPEFGPYWDKCRFTGCSHCGEAGCAVLEALEEGKISQSRYNSYRTLYEEAKQFKEWENR